MAVRRLLFRILIAASVLGACSSGQVKGDIKYDQTAVDLLAPSDPEAYQAAVEWYSEKAWEILEPGWAKCMESEGETVDPAIGYELSFFSAVTVGLGGFGFSSVNATLANGGQGRLSSRGVRELSESAAQAVADCDGAVLSVSQGNRADKGNSKANARRRAVTAAVDPKALDSLRVISNATESEASTLGKIGDLETAVMTPTVAAKVKDCLRGLGYSEEELVDVRATPPHTDMGRLQADPTREMITAAAAANAPVIKAYYGCYGPAREAVSIKMKELQRASIEKSPGAFAKVSEAVRKLR